MFSSALRDSFPVDLFYYSWDSLSGELDSLPLDRVRVEVRAVDRNYYDYVSLQYMGGVDPHKMHLDGGVGVFGSACIIDSTLWFQPPGLPRGELPTVTRDSARPSRCRRQRERRQDGSSEQSAAADGFRTDSLAVPATLRRLSPVD
jgi:hypothetical protein